MASEYKHTKPDNGVIAWFINNPVAANLLMLMILFAGLLTASSLRIEGFPTIPPSVISVDVAYESGDAAQAEQAIAVKIEQALLGTRGIKTITSTSSTKGVSIQVESTSDYNLDKLNTDVKNIVDGINTLPELAEKPVIAQQQWLENALWISIHGNAEQKDLQQLAKQFENALLALPSINKVQRRGWKNPEISIEIDEQLLQSYQLTLDDIATRIRQESLTETSGELRSKDNLILLKADGQRYYQQEFSDIVVFHRADGSNVTLSDIATISDGFAETPNVLSRFQGKSAVTLEVTIDRDANIVEIAQDARALVKQWQQQNRVPKSMEITLWMDQSVNMLERLGLVIENGLIGIALVMLVLTVFLNVKVAFWVGMGLPVCFAGGLIFMGQGFWDLTLNQLTTFGFVLVLGILVDDAVVVGESVYSAQQKLGHSTQSTIIGVNQVAIPTMFGVLTTVAAFYPLSLVDGRLGKLFSQFALVCTACLIFSLIESKFILPAHLRHLNTSRKPSGGLIRRFIGNIQLKADTMVNTINAKVYRPSVNFALHYRYATLCIFLSVFILVVGLIPSGKVAFNFFPDIPEETVSIGFSVQQGAGYDIAHQKVFDIEKLIKQLNQQWRNQDLSNEDVIKQYYAVVENDRSGTVTIELNNKDNRKITATEIAQILDNALYKTEGLQEMLVSLDDHDDKDFILTFLSDDKEALQQATALALKELETVKGVEDVFNNLAQGQAQIKFELTAAGRALGLTTEQLARQIQQSFYGNEVQRLQRGKDEVKVRVRYSAQQRSDITDLSEARIRTPSGEVVALSTVASFKREYVVNEISRKDGYRAASITANIDESLIEADSVYEQLERTVFPQLLAKYPDMKIIQDGDAAEEQESSQSLVSIFAFSLLLIYILVAIPLKSYGQPLVIMAAIPFGIVGAILGHWYMGLAISILSINGMLALSGVVVNDSLLLVNQYNVLMTKGYKMHQALVEAGSLRMRAILLTSITTVLGLVSLLAETSAQGQFLIPAATSLAFGISFATLISLILVPVVLLISYDIKHFLQKHTFLFNAATVET